IGVAACHAFSSSLPSRTIGPFRFTATTLGTATLWPYASVSGGDAACCVAPCAATSVGTTRRTRERSLGMGGLLVVPLSPVQSSPGPRVYPPLGVPFQPTLRGLDAGRFARVGG